MRILLIIMTLMLSSMSFAGPNGRYQKYSHKKSRYYHKVKHRKAWKSNRNWNRRKEVVIVRHEPRVRTIRFPQFRFVLNL